MDKAISVNSDYENIYAICPLCKKESTFNRRDDLKEFNPISYRVVHCQSSKCQKQFTISGDTVNMVYDLLLLEAREYFHKKKYMLAVLLATQALESFLFLFLRVELCYKPYANNEGKHSLNELNETIELLRKETKEFALGRLSGIFLNYIKSYSPPKNLNEAQLLIQELKTSTNKPSKNCVIYVDENLRETWLFLYKSNIASIRNNVIHKHAYRPSQEEADSVIDDVYAILLKIKHHFTIGADDINFYLEQFKFN